MKLLIDIGNTRLKWAAWRDGRRITGGVFAHRETPLDVALSSNWTSLQRPAAILVASVVGEDLERQLAAFIAAQFSCQPEFVRSPAAALGITNAYAQPHRLGVDRFLALAALHAAAPRAQILIGCGTALTLDALAADGRHLGGLIAPSPTLMRQALNGATSRIGDSAGAVVEIAANTSDAAHSGCILAAIALIERFRREVGERLGTEPALTGDGGGFDECMAFLPGAERGRDLVLRGLALWSERES